MILLSLLLLLLLLLEKQHFLFQRHKGGVSLSFFWAMSFRKRYGFDDLDVMMFLLQIA